MAVALIVIAGVVLTVALGRIIHARVLLSRAKHRSLAGHARLARRLARFVPAYGFDADRFFTSDAAPGDVATARRRGFAALSLALARKSPRSIAATDDLAPAVSDVQFVNRYRVPFQYSAYASQHLRLGSVLRSTSGVRTCDLDGVESYDLSGSYGVNLFGHDFYKRCIERGAEHVRDLGSVLGAYHPLLQDNIRRLQRISGHGEVSFHMSGTEAVMQAVRLARFHTGRSHLVRFCGAYHGWWDDVQPGIGNPSVAWSSYTLKDLSPDTLRVLDTRSDIACVLVNPVQALHPNRPAPADGTLIDSSRTSGVDVPRYRDWLAQLRDVCTRRGIALIFDEVFVGFRLAVGGAQEYFEVRADLVTYGKTLGGGLPIGAVCGDARWMKRFRDDRPSDFCFARGTFNSHPYVMGAMHEFLRYLDEPAVLDSYERLDDIWDARATAFNRQLAAERIPVRVVNLVSIWTVDYLTPSRYNWMFQYYLRAAGLHLSWIGTGRFVFSHDYTDADVAEVSARFLAAARAMRDDGWWWCDPALTNQAIRKMIRRELIAAALPAWALPHAASSGTIGSKSSPRST
jgi:glutamate-1-semialdehyde 2,1-aminomutase